MATAPEFPHQVLRDRRLRNAEGGGHTDIMIFEHGIGRGIAAAHGLDDFNFHVVRGDDGAEWIA